MFNLGLYSTSNDLIQYMMEGRGIKCGVIFPKVLLYLQNYKFLGLTRIPSSPTRYGGVLQCFSMDPFVISKCFFTLSLSVFPSASKISGEIMWMRDYLVAR